MPKFFLSIANTKEESVEMSFDFISDTKNDMLSFSLKNGIIEMGNEYKEFWSDKNKTGTIYLGVDAMFDIEKNNSNFKDEILNFFGEELMEEYLKIADSNIKKITTEKINDKLFFNDVLREGGNRISFENLSYGTKRFIYIIYKIEAMYKKWDNSIILIDDLNHYMHNVLCDFIFKRINQLNEKKNIQLIFATHNPTIIELLILKQSFLIDEDSEGIFTVKKISSISGLREKSNFSKKYLNEKISFHPSN